MHADLQVAVRAALCCVRELSVVTGFAMGNSPNHVIGRGRISQPGERQPREAGPTRSTQAPSSLRGRNRPLRAGSGDGVRALVVHPGLHVVNFWLSVDRRKQRACHRQGSRAYRHARRDSHIDLVFLPDEIWRSYRFLVKVTNFGAASAEFSTVGAISPVSW